MALLARAGAGAVTCKRLLKVVPSGLRRYSQSRIAQPASFSHPYLVKEDEVTPGISRAEYAHRREVFALNMTPGSLAILPAYPQSFMSHDIPYEFRQETDLFYYCGLQEPDAVLVIHKPKHDDFETLLFVTDRSPDRVLWDGPTAGPKLAESYFGADKGYALEEFPTEIGKLLGSCRSIYFNQKLNPNTTRTVAQAAKDKGIGQTINIQSVEPISQAQRIVKSRAEAELLKVSGWIAGEAFTEAMTQSKPKMTEGQVVSIIEFGCKFRGASRLSYPPVSAGGINANTLHYVTNDEIVHDGDLILIDAGCEYHGYSSDITRTWPINGQFTDGQRELYDVVVRCNEICIAETREGNTMHNIHNVALRALMDGVVDLGILKSRDQWQELGKLFPHTIGHHLGIDVHDVPSQRGNILKEGMYVTIEPGLYIPDEPHIPQRYRGIGIRVEDDVLVTSEGPEVFTANVVKHSEDVEMLMAQRK